MLNRSLRIISIYRYLGQKKFDRDMEKFSGTLLSVYLLKNIGNPNNRPAQGGLFSFYQSYFYAATFPQISSRVEPPPAL